MKEEGRTAIQQVSLPKKRRMPRSIALAHLTREPLVGFPWNASQILVRRWTENRTRSVDLGLEFLALWRSERVDETSAQLRQRLDLNGVLDRRDVVSA